MNHVMFVFSDFDPLTWMNAAVDHAAVRALDVGPSVACLQESAQEASNILLYRV